MEIDRLPDIRIAATPGLSGNVFDELPKNVKMLIENAHLELRPTVYRDEMFSIDSLGNYSISMNLDSDLTLNSSVSIMSDGIEKSVPIRYIVRIPAPFRLAYSTLPVGAGLVRKISLSDFVRTDAQLTFSHIIFGACRISSGMANVAGIRIGIDDDGLIVFSSSKTGAYSVCIFFRALGVLRQAPITFLVYGPPTSIKNIALPANIVLEEFEKMALVVRDAFGAGTDMISCPFGRISRVPNGVLVGDMEASGTFVFASRGIVNSVKLVPYRPKLEANIVMRTGTTKTLNIANLLEVPADALCVLTCSGSLKTRYGTVQITPSNITISANGTVGNWFEMGYYCTLRTGMNLKLNVRTMEPVEIPLLVRMVAVGRSLTMTIPSACRVLEYSGDQMEILGGDSDSDNSHLTFVPLTCGQHVATIKYVSVDVQNTAMVLLHVFAPGPVETCIVGAGEFFAPKAWKSMFVIQDGIGYPAQDLTADGERIKCGDVEITSLLGAILRDDGFSLSVPGKVEFKYPTNTGPVRANGLEIVFGERIVPRKRDIGSGVRSFVVLGLTYTSGILFSLGPGNVGTSDKISVAISSLGGIQMYTASYNDANDTNTYVYNSVYGQVVFMPVTASIKGIPSATVTHALPASIDAIMPVANLLEPVGYSEGQLVDASITNGALIMTFGSIVTPGATFCVLAGTISDTINATDLAGTGILAIVGSPDDPVFGSAFVLDACGPPKDVSLGISNTTIVLSDNFYQDTSFVTATLASSSASDYLELNGNVVKLTGFDGPGSVSGSTILTVEYTASDAPGAAGWNGVSTSQTCTIRWKYSSIVPLMLRSAAQFLLPSDANPLLYDSSGNSVALTTTGGPYSFAANVTETYDLWFSSAAKLYHRRLTVSPYNKSLSVSAFLEESTNVTAIGLATQIVKFGPVTLNIVNGRGTVLCNSPGTYSALLSDSTLFTVNCSPVPSSWKCTSIADANMPFIVPLPVAGSVKLIASNGADIPVIRNSNSNVCIVDKSAAGIVGVLVITGTDITVNVAVSFEVRQGPLITLKDRSGSFNIPEAIGTFSGSSVIYLAIDGETILDGQNASREAIQGFVESANSTYVASRNVARAIVQSRTRVAPGVSSDFQQMLQVFDIDSNNLLYTTYYDDTHVIMAVCQSMTSNRYITYSGSFSISALVATIKIQIGDTMTFPYKNATIVVEPPLYSPTSQFGVELTPRTVTRPVLLKNFAPSFLSVLSPQFVSGYNFTNRAYFPPSVPGMDLIQLVYFSTPNTIEQTTYLIVRGIDANPTDTAYDATATASLDFNNTLIGLYITYPKRIEMTLQEGASVSIGDASITIVSGTRIEITPGTVKPILSWVTSSQYGTIAPLE